MLWLHSVIRHLVHMIEQAQKELQKLRWVILVLVLKLEVNLSLPPSCTKEDLYAGWLNAWSQGKRLSKNNN